MSYCRFSSYDWKCDVYVYASSGGGWAIHVAGRRHVIPEDLLPPPVTKPATADADEEVYEQWISAEVDRMLAVSALVQNAPLVDIGLPYDGESYYELTPGEAADRLQELQDAGYIVPQHVIDDLRQEQQEYGGDIIERS